MTETDLSKRCRSLSEELRWNIDEPDVWKIRNMLEQAAKEIDRYYNGMMNWKRTAEAKDREFVQRLDKEAKL